MSEGKRLKVEALVSAIKEVAEAISNNGGAEIKALVRETDNGEIMVHIIIEPYKFICEREV